MNRPVVRPCAVVGRGDAEVTAEGLGELGGLAVADPARDLADGEAAIGQQRGGALHADRVRCSRNVVLPISE